MDRDDKHHSGIFVFSPIEAESDKVRLISVIGLDITVRKQAEKEIDLLAKFPAENPNPVLRIDKDGIVSYANKNSMDLLREWGCHKGDRMPEEYCQIIGQCLKNERVHNLEVMAAGRWFSLTFSPVLNGSYVNAYGLDITARKKAEEEKEQLEIKLRQAYKMEAIGTMAGGIAHDFNNILAIVMGNAELALMDIPHNNPARDNMDKILLVSKRMKNLVGQILAFSRQEEQVLLPVKPQLMVRETLALLRSTTPAMVSIVERIDENCRNIMVDPSQFHQLMLNIFSNAVHAIDEEGEIVIGLQEENLAGKDIEYNTKILPGPFVKLSIADNGVGMKQETLDRVCDPFFTTKKVGKGTGMGLAVVHGIVESHDAVLKIVSEPGKGSTFVVYFPVTEEREVEEGQYPEALPRGTERILFIDDEEDITTLSQLVLEDRGYQVRVENRSVEALQIFRSDPENFDLVITDQAMPNMSGLELVHEIHEIRPDIPIIICSGYSEKISKDNAKEFGIREFLMKPLEVKQLINVVRKVLDEE